MEKGKERVRVMGGGYIGGRVTANSLLTLGPKQTVQLAEVCVSRIACLNHEWISS